MRFALSTSSTWVGRGHTLLCVRDGRVVERAHCDRYGTEPAFDANSRACFCVSGGWLVDVSTGRRLGQVLQDQTFLRVGEHLGFGFYRAGLVTVSFLFRTDETGLKHVALPPLRGRLLDAAVAFDDDRLLFETLVEVDGRTSHSLLLIDDSGQLRARLSGSPDEHRCLSAIGNKVVQADRVLCPTDEGLLSLQVDPVRQSFLETALFADTEPFVTTESKLQTGPGGSIYVVHPQHVQHLTLLAKENKP